MKSGIVQARHTDALSDIGSPPPADDPKCGAPFGAWGVDLSKPARTQNGHELSFSIGFSRVGPYGRYARQLSYGRVARLIPCVGPVPILGNNQARAYRWLRFAECLTCFLQ